MTAKGQTQRHHSPEDKASALFGLDLNGKAFEPTAVALDVPRSNLRQWDQKRDDPEIQRATAEISGQKKVSDLAEMFFELARRAVIHSMDNLEKASPYHGALIGAIALDKWALITGRPTSRTEVLRARYVEPDSLRKISSTIVDVPAKRVEDER